MQKTPVFCTSLLWKIVFEEKTNLLPWIFEKSQRKFILQQCNEFRNVFCTNLCQQDIVQWHPREKTAIITFFYFFRFFCFFEILVFSTTFFFNSGHLILWPTKLIFLYVLNHQSIYTYWKFRGNMINRSLKIVKWKYLKKT